VQHEFRLFIHHELILKSSMQRAARRAAERLGWAAAGGRNISYMCRQKNQSEHSVLLSSMAAQGP
jgi:hypothetical protein